MKTRVTNLFFATPAVAFLLATAGCGRSAPAQTPQDQRVDAIVRQSGGDWTRVPVADQETLTRELGRGNAQTAQMNFQARWARLKGGRDAAPPPPPGPPR